MSTMTMLLQQGLKGVRTTEKMKMGAEGWSITKVELSDNGGHYIRQQMLKTNAEERLARVYHSLSCCCYNPPLSGNSLSHRFGGHKSQLSLGAGVKMSTGLVQALRGMFLSTWFKGVRHVYSWAWGPFFNRQHSILLYHHSASFSEDLLQVSSKILLELH